MSAAALVARCMSRHARITVAFHEHSSLFRGGLVFRAHGGLYPSTLGSRVIKKKKNSSLEPGLDVRLPGKLPWREAGPANGHDDGPVVCQEQAWACGACPGMRGSLSHSTNTATCEREVKIRQR